MDRQSTVVRGRRKLRMKSLSYSRKSLHFSMSTIPHSDRALDTDGLESGIFQRNYAQVSGGIDLMNDPQPSSYSFRSEPGGGPTDPAVRRFVLLSILALIVAIVVLFGRAEISRWHQANAQNAFVDQRYEDAVQAANKALEWSPGNEGMIILRAQAKLQNNEFESAIADFEELIAAAARRR